MYLSIIPNPWLHSWRYLLSKTTFYYPLKFKTIVPTLGIGTYTRYEIERIMILVCEWFVIATFLTNLHQSERGTHRAN